MSDLISVIIPAYNHEKYVQETIKSIIAQTYRDIELIVIDDGSSDKTWDRMTALKAECEKRFVSVFFGTQANQGTATTLNNLLSHAKGSYVYLIASDDVAMPDSIEFLHAFLSANGDYGLAVGDNEIINSDSERVYLDIRRNCVKERSADTFDTFGEYLQKVRKEADLYGAQFGTYSSLLWGNYVTNGYLVRKGILDKIGGFTCKAPLEDYYLMLQISKCARMKFFKKVLFKYRQHALNTGRLHRRMAEMITTTVRYEEEIITGLDLKEVLPEARRVLEHGSRKLICKIPLIFELYRNRRFDSHELVFRAFGREFVFRRRKY